MGKPYFWMVNRNKKEKNIDDRFQLKPMSKSENLKYLIDMVQDKTWPQLFERKTIFNIT